eukprot:gene1789-1910_t
MSNSTIDWLKELFLKYPEIGFLSGPAEASPEGNPRLKADSLASKVFPTFDPTAIEADRTFLGLILFKAVLENDATKFPNLSSEKFVELRDFTLSIANQHKHYIDLTIYALACNDLGKTQFLVDQNIRLRGRKAPDHDQLLAEVFEDDPSLFPGLSSLPPEQQEQYKHGLHFNFNLGQMVQGENLPYNLYATGDVPLLSKSLRLVAELYDFAGVTGHINHNISMVMNDDNAELFLQAIRSVLAHERTAEEQHAQDIYTRYIKYRAEKCCLENDPLFYLKGRIASLSRATDPAKGQLITHVWNQLSLRHQSILLRELYIDGFHKKGILIYYFPAVIANAIKAVGDFTSGLQVALEHVAEVYETVRQRLEQEKLSNESGVHTENVSELAKEMGKLSPRSIQRYQIASITWNLFHDSSLDSQSFLREIKLLFPEILLYSTLCDSTPDLIGNIPHPNETLVSAVFEEAEVRSWTTDSSGLRRIGEINKLLLRLVYVRSVIQNDKTLFSSLSSDRFEALRQLVLQSCQDKYQLLFLVLSIIFDDLGRTRVIRELVAQSSPTQSNSNDHDKLWRLFLQQYQDFVDLNRKYVFEQIVPSFSLFTEEEQKRYKNQVMTNSFNLGAFVQGESVPYSFYELLFSSNGDYNHRILVLIFAFISFRYNDQFEAIGFTNLTYDQFITAAGLILKVRENDNLKDTPTLQRLCFEVYKSYLIARARMVEFPADLQISEQERFVLHRVIALSRSSSPIQWKKIWYVWNKLSPLVKDRLLRYMIASGFDEKERAIYVYYAPALIANTIASAKKLPEFSPDRDNEGEFHMDGWTIGLFHGLRKLVEVYEDVTKKIFPMLDHGKIFFKSPHGAGAYIHNASNEAVEMAEFHRALNDVFLADNMDLEE